MSKTKNLFIITLALILIVMGIFSKTYAEYVPVNKENLKTALKELEEYNKESKMEITIDDNIINILADGEKIVIKYDLTDKPKFICETEMKQGMSYEEFSSKRDEGNSVLFGYMAVAKIQGIDFETSGQYYLMNILSSAKETVYLEKTFNVSEFGEHSMEYVNEIYKETKTYNDSDSINSYEMTIKQKDVKETSCIIETTLIVNPEADFSKMESLVKEAEASLIEGMDKVKEESQKSQDADMDLIKKKEEEIEKLQETILENNEVSNLSTMPKAGKTNNPILVSAYIIVSLAFIGIIGLILTRKKQ